MDCGATWTFVNGSTLMSGAIVAIITFIFTMLVMRVYGKRNKRAELEAQDEYESSKRLLETRARNDARKEVRDAQLREDLEPTKCGECDKEYPAWSFGSKPKSIQLGKNRWRHTTVQACRKCRYPEDPTPMPSEASEEYYARLNSRAD